MPMYVNDLEKTEKHHDHQIPYPQQDDVRFENALNKITQQDGIIAKLQRENEKLTQNLENEHFEGEINRLQKRESELLAKINGLEKAQELLMDTDKEYMHLQQNFSDLEQTKNQEIDEIKYIHDQEIENTKEEFNEEINKIRCAHQTETDSLKNEHQRDTNTLTQDYDTRLRKTQDKLDHIDTQNSLKEHQIERLEKTNIKLLNEKDESERDRNRANNKLNSTQENISKYKQDIKDLND
jgi:chromosome segregation ATPase